MEEVVEGIDRDRINSASDAFERAARVLGEMATRLAEICRSRGTVPPATAPASSEKALGTCDMRSDPHTKKEYCLRWRAAAAPPAAREPVASRKPQKRTKPNLCAHGYHVDLKACPFCKERGRRSRKRSPRSR